MVSALSPEVVHTIKAVTRKIPSTNPYETIRHALIARHTPSVMSTLIQILNAPFLSRDSDLERLADRLDALDVSAENLKKAIVLAKFPK